MRIEINENQNTHDLNNFIEEVNSGKKIEFLTEHKKNYIKVVLE